MAPGNPQAASTIISTAVNVPSISVVSLLACKQCSSGGVDLPEWHSSCSAFQALYAELECWNAPIQDNNMPARGFHKGNHQSAGCTAYCWIPSLCRAVLVGCCLLTAGVAIHAALFPRIQLLERSAELCDMGSVVSPGLLCPTAGRACLTCCSTFCLPGQCVLIYL